MPRQPARASSGRYVSRLTGGTLAVIMAGGRGERLKATREMFACLFWNGEDALGLGLVDKIGNIYLVARDVVTAEEIVDYTPHDNGAERLATRFGAAVGYGAVKALRELAPLR